MYIGVSVSAFIYGKDGGTRDANDRIKYTIASRFPFHHDISTSCCMGSWLVRGCWKISATQFSSIDWALTNDCWNEKWVGLLLVSSSYIDRYLFIPHHFACDQDSGESYAIFIRLQFTTSTPRRIVAMDCHFLENWNLIFFTFIHFERTITNWCASISCVRKCKQTIDWRSIHSAHTHSNAHEPNRTPWTNWSLAPLCVRLWVGRCVANFLHQSAKKWNHCSWLARVNDAHAQNYRSFYWIFYRPSALAPLLEVFECFEGSKSNTKTHSHTSLQIRYTRGWIPR